MTDNIGDDYRALFQSASDCAEDTTAWPQPMDCCVSECCSSWFLKIRKTPWSPFATRGD